MEQNSVAKDYPIKFTAAYPEKMSRLTTFFRLLLIIPHAIVLYFLSIVLSVITFIAWLVILFTGAYPKGMYDFAVGIQRWSTRVTGYTMLFTDKYPPFSMD